NDGVHDDRPQLVAAMALRLVQPVVGGAEQALRLAPKERLVGARLELVERRDLHRRLAVSTPGTSFTWRSTRPIASALDTCTVKRMNAWAPRESVFMAVTLIRSRAIASVMSRSSPWRSTATTSTSAKNGASSPVLPQSAGIRRSRCAGSRWVTFSQSCRCTITPRVRVTKPTIGSGGTGLQHLAIIVAMLFTPSTSTPDEAFCGAAGVMGNAAAGCAGAGASPRTAISTWRELTSPRPSA